MDGKKKNIVIVGAGFGGLRAAVNLAQSIDNLKLADRYQIILIDKNAFHTYTPTLYEAATTSKETANMCDLKHIVTFDIREITSGYHIIFIKDVITELDLIDGDIHCGETKLKFDYLVLAMGSETNYFDIPGLKENSLSFKTFYDAMVLRDKVIENYYTKDELRIFIGGAGSTGVELAGELQEWLCELALEAKNKCRASVTIVGAQETVLPGFLPKISKLAEERLRDLGVNLMLSRKIRDVRPEVAVLENGDEVPFDILIWTGGVRAATLMATLPLRAEGGRVVAHAGMECLPQTPDLKLYGKIYGLGDAICVYDPKTQKPVPLVARAAIEQADVVSKNILEEIKSEAKISKVKKTYTYEPKDYPYVVPVGGKFAIAKIGSFVLKGFPAWVFKGLIELYYISSIMPFWRAFQIWLKGLKIFIKNDRLG